MSRRPTVLVVDDAPTIRRHLRAVLEEEFHCLFAVDGYEGLELAREERPDVILSDVEMPEMTGPQMLEALKADEEVRHIPVIMCTTVSAMDVMEQCRKLGCAGYVLKPVNVEYLRAKLWQLLST